MDDDERYGYDDLRQFGARSGFGRNFGNARFSGELVSEVFERCDFDGASFRGSRLDHVTFIKCNLSNTDFTDTTLISTQFRRTNLIRCDFRRAMMHDLDVRASRFVDVLFDAAQVRRGRFTETELVGLSLRRSSLWFVQVDDCTVRDSLLAGTLFVATFLDAFCESESIRVEESCPVDWASICFSIRAPGLDAFLKLTGMPDIFITYSLDSARATDPKMLFKLMRSTFISYGQPDVVFARLLQAELQRCGVATFFFEKDAKPGDRIHEVVREGVNRYDRVILVCSKNSLDRPAVVNEIEQTLAREARTAGSSLLIPITLDDYVFMWKPRRRYLAQEIRDRVVADFRGADLDQAIFGAALRRLLGALKK